MEIISSSQKKKKIIKVCKAPQQIPFPKKSLKNSIYSFSNVIFYNEKAYLDPQGQHQSFIQTVFHFKTITKIQFLQSNVLIIHMDDIISPNYTIDALSETLKRHQNKKLQRFQQRLVLICRLMMETRKNNIDIALDSQKLRNQYIQQNQNQNYFLYSFQYDKGWLTLNRLIVSESFIKILGHDPQKIALVYSRAKCILDGFFNHENYLQFASMFIQILINVYQNILDQNFNGQSAFRFQKPQKIITDLYTTKNEKITAQFSFSMCKPFVFVYKLERIIDRVFINYKQPYISENKLIQQMIKMKQQKTLQQLNISQPKLSQILKTCTYRYL